MNTYEYTRTYTKKDGTQSVHKKVVKRHTTGNKVGRPIVWDEDLQVKVRERRLNGMKFKDIAQDLNISVWKVKKYLGLF